MIIIIIIIMSSLTTSSTGEGAYITKIVLWKRYKDNVFVLWGGSPQELNDFQTLLSENISHSPCRLMTEK
jgi:hypothetical protein